MFNLKYYIFKIIIFLLFVQNSYKRWDISLLISFPISKICTTCHRKLTIKWDILYCFIVTGLISSTHACTSDIAFNNLRSNRKWLQILYKTRVKTKGLTWEEAFPFYLCHIWLTRNDNLHNNKHSPIKHHIPHTLALKFKHLTNTKTARKSKPIFIKRKAPLMGYKLDIDSSISHRNNTSGLGGIIRDRAGNWILGFIGNSSHAYNILAEIQAKH